MKTTQNLGLRKPDPEDFYDVGDFNYNADVLDAEVTAVKNQVTSASAKFDGAAGHRHTGAEGDAPPIGLDGIDAAAKTTPGGTEPNRLAMTDASGRVGDSERVGGQTLANLDARYAPASHADVLTAHLADNAPNARGNQIYHVEVVSSSVSETPDAGRIIFDMSQRKFFGGNGTEWV